ncbi:leishmanolysin-related zinc metalloendopeptidase [Nonomuraea sp. SYSU D8015]|uniref:leishmanolysin-related zinc metalloendopeptidase n=1 Tax=Nonomuraea sp. SYSU D8015 TaxID=2593644 RepID=UPI001660296E|nr:leishmanolysin-related zinc metalloendopeptidase [Nonomuraea sp. SYSU D8015]
MSDFEVFRASASPDRVKALGREESPYTIEVRFLDGLSVTQQAAFKAAARRWTRVIVGDQPEAEVSPGPGLPDGVTPGELIDDIVIVAEGAKIDGPGTILGQALPLRFRPNGLPLVGRMSFDTGDLDKMEADGRLHDVIAHEMGHVLGIGKTVWRRLGLLVGEGTAEPLFIGQRAGREYGALLGSLEAHPVPVENVGGSGSVGSHWRESVFGEELMTSRIGNATVRPLSRLTAAALADLGYEVDMAAAEPYVLPTPLLLAQNREQPGELVLHCDIEPPS